MNFLTLHERDQLRLQHKQERDKRVCDRIKAILLYDEGWTSQQIAKVLLVSDQAVRDHVHDYQTSQKSSRFTQLCQCSRFRLSFGISECSIPCITTILRQRTVLLRGMWRCSTSFNYFLISKAME